MTIYPRARIAVALIGTALALSAFAGCTPAPADQTPAEACALARDAVIDLGAALSPAVSAALASPGAASSGSTPAASPAPTASASLSARDRLAAAVVEVRHVKGLDQPATEARLRTLQEAGSGVLGAIAESDAAFADGVIPSEEDAARLTGALMSSLTEATDALTAFDTWCAQEPTSTP